jgi:hypothetical protein
MANLKMYIWVDPYAVSYGTSMAYAVAKSADQAKEILRNSKNFAYGQYEQKDKPGQHCELGEPDRVLDLPCGEWVYWEE